MIEGKKTVNQKEKGPKKNLIFFLVVQHERADWGGGKGKLAVN